MVERIERIAERGHGDIVAELFKPLPSMVVAHYLGVPDDDRDRFDLWTDAIVAASSTGDATDAADATAQMLGYFARADRAAPYGARRRHRSRTSSRPAWATIRPD